MDHPESTALYALRHPCAFLPKGRGKARVDGVVHHVKYGIQRGYGAMWLHQKTGKTTKRYTIECAAALVGYAALGSYGEAFEAARQDGTFDAMRRKMDDIYSAVSTAEAPTTDSPTLPGF